ncbi:hypothetical protein JK358_12455 [Nocardia sp. 2]|uniref:ESX-1 secretion-associated protein EspA/EspE-like domain-containing protein n=1 Tax=Nocardia acididurans TaxID=2802282 RepID=A0ABS1M5Y4_9NOCA|nr:hypothetical protein [Nocardia acididurans]MBL1075204.1 hypothetical protein [Nocardia acididurans]
MGDESDGKFRLDGNPWLDLSKQARADQLNLDPKAALEAAGFAADAVNAINQALMHQYIVTTHKGFSDNGHLQKALALAGRFDAQGGELKGILKRYIDLLDAMADTLIVADNKYKASEEDSKAVFDRLKRESTARDRPVYGPPAPIRGEVPKFSGDSLPALGGQNGTGNLADLNRNAAQERKHGTLYPPIDPETPFRDGKWFYQAGQGMNPQAVVANSGTWLLIADKVDKAFDQLNGRLERMETSGAWTGKGAKAAIAAANRFETQAADLTSDLRAIAENLQQVAGWIAQTKAELPPTWNPKWDNTKEEQKWITKGVTAFTSWYIPGLTRSSGLVPKLSDPTAKEPGLDPSRPTSPTDPGGTQQPRKPGTPPGSGNPQQPGKESPEKPKNPDGPGKDQPGQQDPGNNDPGKNPPGQEQPGPNQSGNQNNDQSALQQLTTALQGLQTAQQATTTESATEQNQVPNLGLAGLPTTALSDLAKELKGGGGGGGGGGAPKAPLTSPANSKLFPRAALGAETTATTVATARAGIASGTPMMGGMPMGGGMGAGAQGQGGKDHKRADFLDSTEHLEQAMGAPPIVAKPVVEG